MGQAAVGILLILAGSWWETPPIVLLGLVLVVTEGIRQVWVRWGLRNVEYWRHIPHPRGVAGESVRVDVSVWNRKPLPLAWVRVDDETAPGIVMQGHDLVAGDGGPALRNAWTLAPFERVTRHFQALAERRGVYSLGPATVSVGDLFAREASATSVERVDRWLVRPRAVSVVVPDRFDPWGGERRARHGLITEPTRYAGVRPYQPGDPIRSIHWRATARLGTPVSRIFEPGRHREVVVVVDLQTVEGRRWASSYDDDAVETLCLAAASLLRRLQAEGAAAGLAATGYAGAIRPFAYVPAGSSKGQLGRCLDVLARIGSYPSAPIGAALTTLARTIRPGTSIVVLTVRDTVSFAPALRRVAAGGHTVLVVALGPNRREVAERARGARLDAVTAELDGPWRTAQNVWIAS